MFGDGDDDCDCESCRGRQLCQGITEPDMVVGDCRLKLMWWPQLAQTEALPCMTCEPPPPSASSSCKPKPTASLGIPWRPSTSQQPTKTAVCTHMTCASSSRPPVCIRTLSRQSWMWTTPPRDENLWQGRMTDLCESSAITGDTARRCTIQNACSASLLSGSAEMDHMCFRAVMT